MEGIEDKKAASGPPELASGASEVVDMPSELSESLLASPEQTVEEFKARTEPLDWFVLEITNPKVEISGELYEKMVCNARDYLMAGGKPPTWDQWKMLSKSSRDAWIEAATELKIRLALET